jgi:hypothetical protein
LVWLLNTDISIPVDFLAIDYDKYNRLKIEYIYETIEKEGKILYENDYKKMTCASKRQSYNIENKNG